ncbi:MAG: hypothetical protein JW983_02540 [Elusimicrobia bacterium]|nr:hypothetical protein [Elusimicrobiota bacterium]
MTIRTTTIGSLPHKDPKKATETVLRVTPDFPAWAQLPQRGFKENMYVQYSEGFPGVVLDEQNQKIHIDCDKAFSEFEFFYQQFIDNNIDHFSISGEYSSGFYEMKKNVPYFKCQTTGPITFGLGVKDEKGQSIFYNEQLRDVVVKHVAMKSVWQLKQLKFSENRIPIVFLDEPYMASYGSAFTAITKDDVLNAVKETVSTIKQFVPGTLIGIHCCANTDWSVLLNAGIDILSFDAYEFFDNLVLYSPHLSDFVNNGKFLAWGIVPTSEEAIKKETAETLTEKLKKSIRVLVNKGLDKEKILKQLMVTPACGLGSRTVETSERALQLVSSIGNILSS